jgi:hypothetical protein
MVVAIFMLGVMLAALGLPVLVMTQQRSSF